MRKVESEIYIKFETVKGEHIVIPVNGNGYDAQDTIIKIMNQAGFSVK